MNESLQVCKAKALELGTKHHLKFSVWTSEEVEGSICLRFEPPDCPYTQQERLALSVLLLALNAEFKSVKVDVWYPDRGAYASIHKRTKKVEEA
jgi:hypothetical protein